MTGVLEKLRRPALRIVAVAVLALALGAGLLIAGRDDDGEAAHRPAVRPTILVLPPEPF